MGLFTSKQIYDEKPDEIKKYKKVKCFNCNNVGYKEDICLNLFFEYNGAWCCKTCRSDTRVR